MSTKRELREENENLRQKLEEIYDSVGEMLGLEEESESESDEE